MSSIKALIGAVLGLTIVTAAGGAEPPKGYLAAALQTGDMLTGPPEAGSAGAVADQAIFVETRGKAGSARWSQAVADADNRTDPLLKGFDCALGVAADARATPRLARLITRMYRDGDQASESLKVRFARPRPTVANPDAPICIPRAAWMAQSPSYPSGHAMIGWASALILTELSPDRGAEVLARGRAFGDSRAICGVHYASDVEAGRLLAAALVARLHAEPAFQADLKAARRELAAAPKLNSGACPA